MSRPRTSVSIESDYSSSDGEWRRSNKILSIVFLRFLDHNPYQHIITILSLYDANREKTMGLIEWGSGSLIFLNLALTGVDIWLFRSVLPFRLIIEYSHQISSFWFNSDVGFQGRHFKCSTWFTWLLSNWTSSWTDFKSYIINTGSLFWPTNYIRLLGSKCGRL